MNNQVAAPRSLALISYLRFVTFQANRHLWPFIGGLLLVCAGNAYADVTIGLEVLNNRDSNGNITVINGSRVRVTYAVTEDTEKELHKKDRIQLLRVSDGKIISSVERGKKKSGTVSLKVKKSEGEKLYVGYVRKGDTEPTTRTSHPDDESSIPLMSIAKLSLADLTISMNATPKANVASTAPSVNDDIDSGYPEGSVWVDMSQNQAYILVDSTAGAAVWGHVTDHAKSYEIGDTGPAGGIVFYITEGGLHGFEAAPSDLAAVEWGCLGDEITGADGTAIGTGAQNTADILAGCGTAGIAARDAYAYGVNGYADWFLPSKDELNELYENVGGLAAGGVYWSSSEETPHLAKSQTFEGFQGALFKFATVGIVRPVRAF